MSVLQSAVLAFSLRRITSPFESEVRPERSCDPKHPCELANATWTQGWWTQDTLGDLVAARAGRPAPMPASACTRRCGRSPAPSATSSSMARRLAAGLRARGVGPGDVVAFQLPNWMEAAATFWASAFLGAVIVPIVHFYGRRNSATSSPPPSRRCSSPPRSSGACSSSPTCARTSRSSDWSAPTGARARSTLRRSARRRADGAAPLADRPGAPGADRLHLGHHQQPEGRRAQPSDARLRDASAAGELPARPRPPAHRHPGRALHRHARRVPDPGARRRADRPVRRVGSRAGAAS